MKILNIFNLTEDIEVRLREELFINIHPIQPGGRLAAEAMKAIIAYGDGYSTCDWCRKPFRLDKISRPPIDEFHAELAEFLGMDEARVVPGARRGFQAVVSSLIDKGDIVMPRGDGIGPPRGGGSGLGGGRAGRGKGRMGGTQAGVGLDGNCVCSNCSATSPHEVGTPRYNVSYPKCGTRMVRG